jgi:hypothetical protein
MKISESGTIKKAEEIGVLLYYTDYHNVGV